MGSERSLSRRAFLGYSARGAAAAGAVFPLLLSSRVWGANERVGLGYIGVGRRAGQLMEMPDGMEIVAISDVNQARLDALAKKGWKAYLDYREMLESKDVDAVVVATPDHWHALASIHACQAGKDVYCEKPMSLTVREGRAMVDAARKYQRVFQTGSQQRSMDNCRTGCELVRAGRVGTIHTIHGNNYPSPWECTLPEQPVPAGLNWDMWLGQTPVRPYHEELYLPRVRGTEAGWISFRPYSGGEMTGWGAHGLDIIQWAMGMDESGPVEVWPEGEGLKCPVSFRYANGVTVKLDRKDFGGGGVFVGDKGEIAIDRGKYKVTFGKDSQEAPLGASNDSDTTKKHMANWLECIKSRCKPIADVEIGHRSATMCHLGNIARWTGRKLKWNPEKEAFEGDEDANSYLQRPMRAPWTL